MQAVGGAWKTHRTAGLAIIDRGGFPFTGDVPVIRGATAWVFENTAMGRWFTLSGTGFSIGPAEAFPVSAMVAGLMPSTTQAGASQSERVFVLAELTLPVASLAPALANPAGLGGVLLVGMEIIVHIIAGALEASDFIL